MVPKDWHLVNGRIRWGGGVWSVVHTLIETEISHGLLVMFKIASFVG